jgi:hypothetical protein
LGLRQKQAIQAEKPEPGCGASINEDKTSRGGEKLAGLRLKGHFPEKDGALAGLLSEAFVAETSLSGTTGGHRWVARAGLR